MQDFQSGRVVPAEPREPLHDVDQQVCDQQDREGKHRQVDESASDITRQWIASGALLADLLVRQSDGSTLRPIEGVAENTPPPDAHDQHSSEQRQNRVGQPHRCHDADQLALSQALPQLDQTVVGNRAQQTQHATRSSGEVGSDQKEGDSENAK